jgi:hypothetical protein
MYRDRIVNLAKRLYPTGRAFKIPVGGDLEKLHKGIAISVSQLHEDCLSTFDSLLPDNANFTTDDATDWERRLGIITNTSVSLSDRMLAIAAKLNHPGLIPERSSYLYLQDRLRAAGFNVYVHENRFASGGGYVTQTPGEFVGSSTIIQHNGWAHGAYQHGGGSPSWGNVVANYIEESLDASFNVGGNLRSTFFVGGQTPGTYANVPTTRKNEFRQLILQVKTLQTVAYLLINYV